MNIKQGLRQSRYWLNWNYPRLYDFFVKATFPAQIIALCLVLTSAVNFYKKHYSFEATARQQQIVVSQKAQADTVSNRHPFSDAAEKHYYQTPSTPVTTVQRVERPTSIKGKVKLLANLSKDIQTTEQQLRAQIKHAEGVLKQKKLETELLEKKVQKAKVLLNSAQSNAESNSPQVNKRRL